MKKISINKTDDAAAVVGKMLREPDPEIVLVVPKGSKLKNAPRNFRLIKREAEAAGRQVSVESVDDEVLDLAEASGLYNEHPLFAPSSRSVSDIVRGGGRAQPGSYVSEEEEEREVQEHISAEQEQVYRYRPSQSAGQPVQNTPRVNLSFRPDEVKEEKSKVAEKRFFNDNPPEEVLSESHESATSWEEEDRRARKRKSRRKWMLAFLVVFALLGGSAWITGAYFSSAEVSINFDQKEWQFSNSVTASKNATKVDVAGRAIPAEVFRDKRNLTQLFPASGKAAITQKATGKMVIVNAYSSEKQKLVATTRFSAPDGKIFRLDKEVVVPGAQIKDGKIIPASIEASITADKAGAEYNVGPIDKLVIPGFKGTPKYEGFYGKLEKALTGGFSGEKAVPTDADISNAQDRMTEILKSSLENNILVNDVKDYKVLEGASDFHVNKMSVKKETNDSGQFSIFAEAEIATIGFKEQSLDEFLSGAAAADLSAAGTAYETSFRSLSKEYGEVKADYAKGELKLTLSAKGVRAAVFNSQEFTKSIAGKSAPEAMKNINALPGLRSGKILTWPRWVTTLPGDVSRIKLVAD